MTFPLRDPWRLSAEFWQSRPLSADYHSRTHPHGSWDGACAVGTRIVAPEAGQVVYLVALRSDPRRTMAEINLPPTPFRLRGHHYFYDVYGGLVILAGVSGLTHVITHSYASQLINRAPMTLAWGYAESKADERWPVCAWHTFEAPAVVREGDPIGLVGNAGFSTGAHIHYEIHGGREYQDYRDRVDPATVYPAEWAAHQGDSRGYDWRAERERWA